MLDIKNVILDNTSIILMGAVINIGAQIGKNTMIDMNAVIGSGAVIGKNCHIGAGAVIAGVMEPISNSGVVILDNVLITLIINALGADNNVDSLPVITLPSISKPTTCLPFSFKDFNSLTKKKRAKKKFFQLFL